MYVRIAPQSDSEEVAAAKSDYADAKKKIDEKHPDSISIKAGHITRRAIEVTDGLGTLKKEGQENVLCYYFAIRYVDDYSDYSGGSIVCKDGNSIDIADERRKFDYSHSHILKGNCLFHRLRIDSVLVPNKKHFLLF